MFSLCQEFNIMTRFRCGLWVTAGRTVSRKTTVVNDVDNDEGRRVDMDVCRYVRRERCNDSGRSAVAEVVGV